MFRLSYITSFLDFERIDHDLVDIVLSEMEDKGLIIITKKNKAIFVKKNINYEIDDDDIQYI